jgi:hypothetical protein
MKTNSIILVIILGFLMLGMMVTNPSLDDHRKEVAELLKKTISNGGNPTSGDIKLPTASTGIIDSSSGRA